MQEMIRLQKEEYSTLINARAVLPRIWDEHYYQPPEGGMPLWEEMTARQQQALTLIAQCVATECECAIIDAGGPSAINDQSVRKSWQSRRAGDGINRSWCGKDSC